ncbi:uncharacterized protein [Rutidosis leptorrhynchoides]|uniref:uncharacterized protein n=1 Tax=Rutidosis leptorrhynchoides TaxID=125765 RepID=UPI003A9A1013
MDNGDVVRPQFKKMKYGEFGEQRSKLCDFRSGAKGDSTKNVLSTLDLTTKLDYVPSQEIASTQICGKRKGLCLDLNGEDASSSYNQEPFHLYKNNESVELRDTLSECGSTCGSMVEKDSMKIWKQMKQNGFLSSSHGGVWVPPMPKPRGRKQKNESVIMKKIEMAKREQVNKFAKVAAPSGLLNELNPGIINHVRNRKQVHSIIENLVRSTTKNKNNERKKVDGTKNILYTNKKCEDDVLRLKLSSTSTMTSENMSTLSNDESATVSTVDSLSVKAANVASQWLELLHQDIKGRLEALRHSKKRVQYVIQTELPSLISSYYLSSNQENESSVVDSTNKTNNEMHKLRWTALFDQMDKSLSEEEKNLEYSLNQVRDMLMRCEHGLFQYPPANGSQQQGTLQSNYIYPKAEPALDKVLAVRAAAAAIYSTSNFLQSVENPPCF